MNCLRIIEAEERPECNGKGRLQGSSKKLEASYPAKQEGLHLQGCNESVVN